MKHLLSFILVALSFTSFAAADDLATQEIKNGASLETVAEFTIGPKKDRRSRRINKKRKRKCQQFGRRAYAG